MGVDVFVIPLWRFKAGDFSTTTADLLGGKVKTVGLDGSIRSSARPKRVGLRRRLGAKREVKQLATMVSRGNRTKIRWRDVGEKVFSEKAHGDYSELRAFAAYVDARQKDPGINTPADGKFSSLPLWKRARDSGGGSFPHIIQNSLFCGFILPVDFARPVLVQTQATARGPTIFWFASSAPRVLGELRRIEAEVIRAEHFRAVNGREKIAASAAQLRRACEKAIAVGLPVVFYG